jgi:hypothetical protein
LYGDWGEEELCDLESQDVKTSDAARFDRQSFSELNLIWLAPSPKSPVFGGLSLNP